MIGYNIKSVVSTIFSFEMVFVLYLFAGRFKNDPRFEWVPIDLTIFFLLTSVGAALWVLYKRRWRFRRQALTLAALFILFVSYTLLSFFWTPSILYATEKLGYFAILTLWPFLACTIIISDERPRIKRFALIIVGLSIWFVVESLIAFSLSDSPGQQIDALGGRYLGVGRVIGPAAMVLIVYSVFSTRAAVRFASFTLFGLYIATLLLIGGRGPFIATIFPLTILIYYAVNVSLYEGDIRIRKYILPLLIFIILGIVFLLSYGSERTFSTARRMSGLLGNPDASTSIRLVMYGQALDVWAQRPLFGAGIGAWPVMAGWGDQRMYPHNIVLEVLSEFGFVGLVLLVTPFIYALWHFIHNQVAKHDTLDVLVLLLVGNALINAMFTGDLTDNRILFAFLGLLILRNRHPEGQQYV